MKALKIKTLIWILIILKFLDIITTIIGVQYLGFKELNPIGYDAVIIISIIYMLFMYAFIKYYDKINNLKSYIIITYKELIIILHVFVIVGFIVVTSNIIHIINR